MCVGSSLVGRIKEVRRGELERFGVVLTAKAAYVTAATFIMFALDFIVPVCIFAPLSCVFISLSVFFFFFAVGSDLADADHQWEGKRLDSTDPYNERNEFFNTTGTLNETYSSTCVLY